MNNDDVIKAMMILLEDISREVEVFTAQSGLKCKSGCGACCSTPDIETTVAEVLPMAAHLWSQGLAADILEKIRLNPAEHTCIFYDYNSANRTQGRCSHYAYRPGLCRLFGFSVRTDKYSKPVLMTCKIIKDSQPVECQHTQEAVERGTLPAPLLAAHAFAVANIDPIHGQELLPINQAVGVALAKIGYAIEKLKQ